MRMTISRKLIGAFLILSLLVLLSGLVGIAVLNKVSVSADTVAKEKSPAQYAVMNAALSLDNALKFTEKLSGADFHLDEIQSKIKQSFQKFDMWIEMLRFGTKSDEFTQSPSIAIYRAMQTEFTVPRASEQMLTLIEDIVAEKANLQEAATRLFKTRLTKTRYGVVLNTRLYPLPDYLNLAQRSHLEWTKNLKDAVNIETKFTGNTDPTQGIVGSWLNTYKVEDEALMKSIDKLKKQYIKLLSLAQKINSQESFKDKQRSFNRGIGTTAKIDKYFNALHEESAKLYTRLDDQNQQAESALAQSAEIINEKLQKMIGVANQEMLAALTEAASAKKNGITILIVLTIVAVIVAGILGTFMSRFMSSRILSIAESSRKIAAGDLRSEIEVKSNDELGDLAQDTNAMVVHLRNMIGQILSFSGNLTQSASDLSVVSTHLDDNANDLNAKSTAAADATETMDSSMAEISTLANESMERVQNVALATEEMASTIAEISQNTEQARTVTNTAVSTVENTTLKMNELSEAANEIGQVADVIVNIAEQTNLLSLNATIEAARAGEAGKGFAVVANEVKELAGQTNKATVDIREKITAIQQSSDMTIQEITEITEIINNINSIVVMIAGAVEEQAATTKQITEDINSVADGIKGMTGHVDSAAEISTSMASDIHQVTETSKSIGDGSTSIQENSHALKQLAGELNQLVGQFKL